MTKVQFRRWVVHIIELTIKYTFAMIVMFCGCLVVCLFIGWCLKMLGVA